jgi:hypothetical protein
MAGKRVGDSSGGWTLGRRRREPNAAPVRVLTAAASRVNLSSRNEAKVQRQLRQNWQLDAMCVDTDTEILTTRGWLNVDDLLIGDFALTLNHDTGLSQWQPVEAINVYASHRREMIQIEGKLHSSLSTVDHRWPVIQRRGAWTQNDVDRRRARRHGVQMPSTEVRPAASITREWRTTETLSTDHSLITAAQNIDLPTEAKYGDAFVELVAWWWTEGYYRPHGYSTITQSQRVNPLNVERIRAALTQIFGPAIATTRGVTTPAWRESTDGSMVTFALNASAGKTILAVAHGPKIIELDFILSLTRAQLELFITTSIAADGCMVNGAMTISQSVRERLEPLMLAAILTGRTPHLFQADESRWNMHIRDKATVNPIGASRKQWENAATVERISFDGDVWCPVTENKSWMARRDGTVYFTGNTYRDSVPEVRFANNFLANISSRMRIFPAALPIGGETDDPVELKEAGAPDEWIAACNQMMADLGNGRLALGSLMHALSTNFSTTGECFLYGEQDESTLEQTWSIRSVNEIVVFGDKVQLREGPIASQGNLGLVDIDPLTTFVARMWNPHPFWRLYADSPMRSIMNSCENLLILRRGIRAVGRSRLAGAGLLLMPDDIDITSLNDDDADPQDIDFMGKLADAMMTPITNEGDAAAVVPLIAQANAESLKEIRLIDFYSKFDEHSAETRAETIREIAIGVDLPAEVINGISNANHFTAFQIGEDTFRYHAEPHVITEVDSLTMAYARPYLSGVTNLPDGMMADWLPRTCLWYDPAAVIVKPDRTANATAAHSALVISDAAYRKYLGFDESDAPSAGEIELRMVRTTRTWPPNVLLALLHLLDPNLTVPSISGPGIIPGVSPSGVSVPTPPPGMAAPEALPDVTTPTPGESGVPGLSAPTEPDQAVSIAAALAFAHGATEDERAAMLRGVVMSLEMKGHRVFDRRYMKPRDDESGIIDAEVIKIEAKAITAAVKPEPKPSDTSLRLSRKLGAIDTDLRSRLTVAANAAMLRQLEKAGNRVRQSVKSAANARQSTAPMRAEHVQLAKDIADLSSARVASAVGIEVVERMGLTAAGLMANDWGTFKDQFFSWTKAAQKSALAAAVQLTGNTATGPARIAAEAALAEGVEKGWELLSTSMDNLAQGLLYSPDLNTDIADAVDALTPDTLVPTGVVRAAVGIAGGSVPQDYGLTMTKAGVEVPSIALGIDTGGVGTGTTISGFLTDAGCQNDNYEWQHGVTRNPLDSHLALDGVQFTSFTDDVLANPNDFPSNQWLVAGDHGGCSCTIVPLWIGADDVQAARDAADAMDSIDAM